MSNFIEVQLDDDMKIYLETAKDDIQQGDDGLFSPVVSDGRIIGKTREFLDTTFSQIKTFSNGIADSIKNLDLAPDEFEVEFAVKFASNAGIIISSVGSEANIKIKLKWSK